MDDQIRQALRKSSSVLLFDSPNSRSSEWVKRELAWAKDEGIDIVNWPIENAEERLKRSNSVLQAPV